MIENFIAYISLSRMGSAIQAFLCSTYCALLAVEIPALAQPAPALPWITNSSVKLEQVIGDVDWEAKAQGSNLLTASQTITRDQPNLLHQRHLQFHRHRHQQRRLRQHQVLPAAKLTVSNIM